MQYTAFERAGPRQYVGSLNDNQWQSRCLAWMVAMSPAIHADEAGRIVAAACTVRSFREMEPEDAAERLLSDPVIRATDATPAARRTHS